MIRKALFIGLTVGLLTMLTLQSAYAIFGRNTFEREAQLTTNNRHILLTVKVACTAGEKLSINVTVTQEETGAEARGNAQTFCEDIDFADEDAFQYVPVRAVARGPNRFIEGHAEAEAVAVTRARGTITEVREWHASQGLNLSR